MAEAYLQLECGRATREEHVEGYWTDDGWQDPHTLQVPYGFGHRIPLGDVTPDADGTYEVAVAGMPTECPICGAPIHRANIGLTLPAVAWGEPG